MKTFTYILFLGMLFAVPFSSHANYLRITNITPNYATGTVTFTIRWDNSWRIINMGTPNHWDAAWVFIKWRDCSANNTTDWTHGLVSTTLAQHTFGNLEPINAAGTAVAIDAAPNNTGVMLRRNTDGLYSSAAATTVTLKLTNLPASGNYDVRVMGIEMVYVPQASYILGGTPGVATSPFDLQVISNENAINLTFDTWNTSILPAAYPKGYNAFHCMKYEISQGQYAAFLNTIPAPAQLNRFNALFYNNGYRYQIQNTGTLPDIYFSDRPDRACNYLNWTDLLAYLDWAALRPMTELQYEKACRGNDPYILGGAAWGSTNFVELTTLSSPENGTEVSITPNANCNYMWGGAFSGGDGNQGPVRVGIFATSSTTTRQATGASYYGILELSGNVWEQCVQVEQSDAISLAFTGTLGNGSLDANGDSDVIDWPYQTGASIYRCLRGGSWADNSSMCTTSNRVHNNTDNSRNYTFGGRGIR